jgi:hypothetical protein
VKRWSQACLGSLAVATVASVAPAQLSSVTPFTGAQSESFEGPQVLFTACLPQRVFNNNGDLCTPGTTGCHTTTNWSHYCSIYPNSGSYLYGSASGSSEITLDQGASRFGGWFGTNSNAADAMFEIYDTAGVLMASTVGAVPNDCQWHWLGWQAPSNQLIKRIVVTSLSSSAGSIQMDDLQVDFGIAPPTVYCTGKVNSLGCTPAIAASGAPDHTGATAFDISAANILGNKYGHLFYGVAGPAALPFKGGTLCVAQPIRRTAAQFSGGAASTCTGTYHFDFNQYCASGTNPALLPGTTVWAQYWSFDPGFAPPNRASYSDAIRFSM